jgi:hypothetical protein
LREKLTEEHKCFAELAAERNRAIHFFHQAYEGEADPKLLEDIAIRQMTAGALLMGLLQQRWKSQFETHSTAIKEIDRSLHSLKQYLTAKFEIVRPKLEQFKAKGGEVWECWICKMVAAEIDQDEPLLKKARCLVCDRRRTYIVFCVLNVKNAMLISMWLSVLASSAHKRTISIF